MLVRIDAQRGRLCGHINADLYLSHRASKIVGGDLGDQLCLAVFELRNRFASGDQGQRLVGNVMHPEDMSRRLENLSGLVAQSILLDKELHVANAMRIVNMDRNWRALPDCAH